MDGQDAAPALGRARPVTDRERFLTFALAAAEILLEVSPEGRISFAAGALRSRFGLPPEAWIDRSVRDLLALPDRAAFDIAFDQLRTRDRMPPTTFRLSGPRATPMSFAGLRLPDRDAGQLCLTIAALSAAPALGASSTGPGALRDLAEVVCRDRQASGHLALVEMQTVDGPLVPDAELAEALNAALAEGLDADSVAGVLAGGRFGLMSSGAIDAEAIAARLVEVAQAAGHPAIASTRTLPLGGDGLTPLQATRALRFALAGFARSGPALFDEAGFGAGLSGFVEVACNRAVWLRHAITERRFHMAFQPIVGLADRRTRHWEALVRPDVDGCATLSEPQDFVVYAETVGLSEELDWAVLSAICAAARRFRLGRLAVNISGLSISSPAFRQNLLGLLDAEPLLAHRLVIEITETAEIEDEAAAAATVEALRARGVPLCIDDFGAGAAAFRYLRAFRVDYVKIDGLYVANAALNPRDRGIVAAMVDLARNVDAEVVAERIETEAEAALMAELGVTHGQGWLFGRPGPLPER